MQKKVLWALIRSTLFISLFASSQAFATESASFSETINTWFGVLVGYIAAVSFFDILFFMDDFKLPFVVA